MYAALNSGKYRWRSIERLAVISGVSENQAMEILRSEAHRESVRARISDLCARFQIVP
jgi:hypothetical protein